MAAKTETFGPFLGVDNRLPEHQLGTVDARNRKAGNYLRNAVNADITDKGTLRRRHGSTKVATYTAAHSLWGDDEITLCVRNGALCRVNEDFTLTELVTGLAPDRPVSYARLSHVVFWSNGAAIGRIVGGAAEDVALAVMNPPPVFAASTGGALPAGRYMVAATRRSSTGEESGSTIPAFLSVPANGRITVSGASPGGTGWSVYLSPANGDILFRVANLSSGTTSYTISANPNYAGRLQTQLLRPMPAGHIVAAHNGRLLVAAGTALYYSEPFAPGLHNPSRGYAVFPSRITVVAPFEDGVYVVADKTYWVAGANIDQGSLLEVLPYGAIEGSLTRDAEDKAAWWFSSRGLVKAIGGGNVENLQEERVAVDLAATGATYYREWDGMRQLISSLFGTETSNAAATSYMDAEVVRKEKML